MKAFARFKNEIWCMDLAYIEKLAKDNNGVNYLLDRQDMFDRTVDAKGMKTTEFAGEFKKLCKAEGIQIYSTMGETKAAFAERTIRS